MQRVASQKIEYLKLQTVFLTHLHSDHTLDLVTLLQINDSTPLIARKTPLNIYGCEGTGAWFDTLMLAFPGIYPSTYELSITEFGKSQWNWEGFSISTILTKHTDNSIAFRFNLADGSFVYTGDATLTEELIEFCTGVDLLICECSFPAGWETIDHMNSDTLGDLAEGAKPKHLVVTHRYPPAISCDIREEIGRKFKGKITLAVDGSKFHLERTEGLE